MVTTLFLFIYLVAIGGSFGFHDSIAKTLKEDLELERKLKLINKPPVKSIQTKYGYIVDCIDINKQPAFDHPLLKNHKVQSEPSFKNTTKNTNSKISTTKPIFGLEEDYCPKGSIPIRRTTKDDLIRSQSLTNSAIETHVAQVTLKTVYAPYYGVSGTNGVYNPKVEKGQSSLVRMWVQNGLADKTNLIAFGWHVAPDLYNDDKSHLFAMWTADNSQTTGCFNMQCPGFVQTSQQIFLGATIEKTSTYGGSMEEISISIYQDPETKHWWLQNSDEKLGYYPSTLFPNLSSADQVGWGGITTNSEGGATPPMGSGYFPDDTFRHGDYFINVAFQNESRKNFGPDMNYMAISSSDNQDCFKAEYYGNLGQDVGYSLQFGGPGGSCNA